MSEYSNLLLDLGDPVAVLTVHRPDKLNALDRQTIVELGEALEEIGAAPQVRGVIVTGSGEKAFVAGADIRELAGMSPLEGVEVSRLGQQVFRAIEQSRLKIPIAATYPLEQAAKALLGQVALDRHA